MRKYLLVVLLSFVFLFGCITPPEEPNTNNSTYTSNGSLELSNITYIHPASYSQIASYLSSASNYDYGYGVMYKARPMLGAALTMAAESEDSAPQPETPEYSTTNVQVAGIDEPDFAKSDGKNIYLASSDTLYSVLAYPPEDLKENYNYSDLDYYNPQLLLSEDNLIVLSNSEVKALDKDSGDELWALEFKDNEEDYYGYVSLVDSRLINDKLILVYSEQVSGEPIPICTREGRSCVKNPIPLERYYLPPMPYYASEQLYKIYYVNASNGKILDSAAITGSYSSYLYVSNKNIYLVNYYSKSPDVLLYSFILENNELFPAWFVDRVRELNSYNISEQSKLYELRELINRDLRSSFNSEEAWLNFHKKYNSKFEDYLENNLDKVQFSIINKFSIEDNQLGKLKYSKVVGKPLNQFSMDEYEGSFRIATSVFSPYSSWTPMENRLYIFTNDLENKYSSDSFGLDEKIYSVRFVSNLAYVVTYKQTDPFFIFDLSDPQNIELKGELKLPGYSSYLHPISDSQVLGIGKDDNNNVKLTLFDVSDPSNPEKLDGFSTTEYWSETISNHHAFMYDSRKGYVFLPIGENMYAFSINNSSIYLEKILDAPDDSYWWYQDLRAFYIGDYLYLVQRNTASITAYEEGGNWTQINEIGFGRSERRPYW